jgi:hypothetical protein
VPEPWRSPRRTVGGGRLGSGVDNGLPLANKYAGITFPPLVQLEP